MKVIINKHQYPKGTHIETDMGRIIVDHYEWWCLESFPTTDCTKNCPTGGENVITDNGGAACSRRIRTKPRRIRTKPIRIRRNKNANQNEAE